MNEQQKDLLALKKWKRVMFYIWALLIISFAVGYFFTIYGYMAAMAACIAGLFVDAKILYLTVRTKL
jgi:hypothetical protein